MTTATTERPKISTVFADSMGHDIMAFILNKLRTMPDHWARMNQEMQEKAIAEMRDSVTNIVQQSAAIVMRAGFQAVGCELDGIQIKDEVKIGLTMTPGDPGRHALYDAKGRKALLVLVDVAQWTERMEELKSDKGQLQLLESDETQYNPARDQPKYRRDEDRVAPVGMTWDELKKNLNARVDARTDTTKGEPPKTLEELGLVDVVIVWPTGERQPIAEFPKFGLEPGETTVQALERAFPGCTFERPEPAQDRPALDPLDTKGANITGPFGGEFQYRMPPTVATDPPNDWQTVTDEFKVDDEETIRQVLEHLHPGAELRFVPNIIGEIVEGIPLDEIGLACATLVYPDGTEKPLAGFVLEEGKSIEDALRDLCQKEGATLQVLADPAATDADGEPLVYGSAALPPGSDPQASDLLERLFGIGMTINLEAIKKLSPEQRALTRRWLGDWLDAFDNGTPDEKLPARPHFLPLFTPPARKDAHGKDPTPPAGKNRKPRKPH